MNYKKSKVYLEDISKYGSVLGLENMKEMLDRLGNPQDDLKFIHISGTNGKGSVLSYISTVLKEAGYVVGRYVSPTLFRYEERIQVNEEEIAEEPLSRFVTIISEVIREMEAEGKTHPTVFEVETVMGFLYFKEMGCDFVILETGLGGLLDATNVVRTSIMEVITQISMDHMGFLGDTLEEIAKSKAGIIKPCTAVVTCHQAPEAMDVIAQTAREQHCSLSIVEEKAIRDVRYGYETQRFSYKKWKDMEISLAGTYQIENAVLALEAVGELRALGIVMTDKQVYEGMKRASWRGRFTVIHKEPLFIIDGAHNEAAAKMLADSFKQYFPDKKIRCIMGVFRDKEYEKIIQLTAPFMQHVITIETPDNERAMKAAELADVWSKYHSSAEAADTIEHAVDKSMELSDKEDVIVAFGSLSFLGEVTRIVEKRGIKHGSRED